VSLNSIDGDDEIFPNVFICGLDMIFFNFGYAFCMTLIDLVSSPGLRTVSNESKVVTSYFDLACLLRARGRFQTQPRGFNSRATNGMFHSNHIVTKYAL
jgi:hypothetical protein